MYCCPLLKKKLRLFCWLKLYINIILFDALFRPPMNMYIDIHVCFNLNFKYLLYACYSGRRVGDGGSMVMMVGF